MEKKEPYVCTKENPWTPEKGTPVTHPDAKYLGDRDFGLGEYCEQYECPHCGKSFYVELPQ